jgi:hypothetical protein
MGDIVHITHVGYSEDGKNSEKSADFSFYY